MFRDSKAFAGFSARDTAACRQFYAETLGLDVTDEGGMLTLRLAGGGQVIVYPKENHQPATFTVLNFPVPDVDGAVDRLRAAGVEMERYEGMPQDEKGIMRGKPAIAWFTDPAGNILSVIEDESAPDEARTR